MSTVVFYAQFTASKIGKNSITVTWDVDRITRSDGTRSALITGGANSVTIGRRGLYGYVLIGADLKTYDYVATAITSDATVDQQEIPALQTYWSQDGLTASEVWANATRTLSSYGTLVSDIWDEILTGATHNINNSAGKRLRQLASQVVHSGVAQGAGVNGNQIILDAGASSLNGSYDPSVIAIVGGTGSGQCRNILDYVGSTRVATVDRTWRVNPDITSEFIIYANAGREHVNEGLAQGGTINTITLNSTASSANDAYNGQLVFIRSGTGDDQVALVTDYDGTTKVAIVDHNWDIIPDTTSAYVMLPNKIYTTSQMGNSIWTYATRTLSAFGFNVNLDSSYDSAKTASSQTSVNLIPTNPLLTNDSRLSNLDATISSRSTNSGVWSYVTRTLTSGGGGGLTAREVWEYDTRTLTSWREVITDFWNAIPTWFGDKISNSWQNDISIYRGITNSISFVANANIAGSSDIVFTVKNKYQDPDEKALIQISMLQGLKVLNGQIYSQPSVDGSIVIINESSGEVKVILESNASELIEPAQQRIYDIKSRQGNNVKRISYGKINLLPDVTNKI